MGGFYIKGGLYALAEAYRTLAEELGVRIHCGPEIAAEEILVQKGRAVGLRLAGGREIEADPGYCQHGRGLYRKRTAPDALEFEEISPQAGQDRRTRAELQRVCAVPGVNRQYRQLAHHNIFFSQDYAAEFNHIFKLRQPSFDPTIYVCWTGHSDPTHAPEGKSNLFVLVNAPYLSEAFDWEKPGATKAYRDMVVRHLETFGLHKLSEISRPRKL